MATATKPVGDEPDLRPRRKASKRDIRVGGKPNSRLLQAARATAVLQAKPVPAGDDHVSWLQTILNQRLGELQVVQANVETLQPDEMWRDTMSGRMPNEWIRLRDQYRGELEQMLFKLVSAGLADRAVKVREAQAVLLAQQVRAAAERAGLSGAQIQALGRELRSLSSGEEAA